MRSTIFIIILLVLGFATRFLYFGYPNQVVFDEVYFGKYAVDYTTGNYYFDPHPPLGKLLLSIGAKASPDTLSPANFETIGQIYPNSTYAYLRFLPTLLGALLPLLMYLFVKKLLSSETQAFVAGLLTVLETLFIVQSRFMFIDIFLVFFGILGLLFYLYYREPFHNVSSKTLKPVFYVAAIVFAGLAVCIKWTGAPYLALIALVEFSYLLKTRSPFKLWIRNILLFVLIPAILYIGIFALHFSLLPNSGEGDAFMSPQFQKTLQGNSYYGDSSLANVTFKDKLFEIHKVILDAEKGLEATPHSYGSKWYTWPLMLRPIYYWVNQAGNARIYLIGNVFTFWLSTLAVGFLVCIVIKRVAQAINHRMLTYIKPIELFLLVAFLGNWLPFMLIHRVMFLYHYFSALIFAYVILVYEISLIKNKKVRIFAYSTLVLLGVMGYCYFFPLTYGLPLEYKVYMSKVWLKSWL